jgi:tetratricopeptide (TPR) repeat protein
MSGVPSSSRRFEIALSFPGEHRGVVEKVAEILASKFTSEQILYDEYHDAEFSAPDLDIYLPPLYLDDSELIVVFLCQEYAEKTWCKLEWRNIRQMIGRADARRIMFLSFGKLGRIPELGILEGDGKLDITGKTPELIAQKILKRLDLNRGSTPPPSITPPPPNTGPIHLPQPRLGNLFTGREDDIKNLTTSHFIGPHHPGEKPLVLYGPPGVGKTTLACELLYHLHDAHLLSHILHIPAADPAALPTLLADLALKVGAISSAQGPVDPAAAHLALCQWLTKSDIAGKALLYFDNADTPAARDAVLTEIKTLAYPRALVTSRRDDWHWADLHPVHDWTPVQAAKYLGKCLPDLTQPEIDPLTAALGGLPLAFELAVALIGNQGYTVPDLLARWRSRLAEQTIPNREGNPTVSALLAVSLESLDDEALELIEILAFLAPQPIPEALIPPVGVSEWRAQLAALHSASLLTWDKTDHTATLHPFLREAILQGIPAHSWEDIFTRAAEMLSLHLPPYQWTPNRWHEWPELLPHCAAFTAHAGNPRLLPTSDAPWVRPLTKILATAGSHYQARAAYANAEPFKRDALRIDRAAFGGNHPEVAILVNNLANLLQATNRLAEAEPLMRDSLRIDRAAFGEDHPRVAIDLNNLANLLQSTNRLAEAEPLIRDALRIDRAAYGEDHPDVAIDLNNLAQLLQSTNRMAEAESLIRDALRIDRAAYGEDHPRVATGLNNLVGLLMATNRLAEAEPLMRDALRTDRAAYGENHPDVARDLNNLARVLRATNPLAEVEPLYREAVRIFHDSLGPEHPSTVTVAENLEMLHAEMDGGE